MNRVRFKRLFNPDLPVFAQATFSVYGQEFTYGDEIPWKELNVPTFTVHSWFRLRQISHSPQGERGVQGSTTDAQGNRLDGPTIEEWVAQGYLPENYPPAGWAAKVSPGYEQFLDNGTGPWDHSDVKTLDPGGDGVVEVDEASEASDGDADSTPTVGADTAPETTGKRKKRR